jgi:hypothetical protein
VQSGDPPGNRQRLGDGVDGQRRRVGGEDRVRPADRLEPGEQRPLDLEVLDHRLDYEPAAGQVLEGVDGAQPGRGVLGLLLEQPALVDRARQVGEDRLDGGGRGAAGRVVHPHLVPGDGGDLRDAGAHGAGPDDADGHGTSDLLHGTSLPLVDGQQVAVTEWSQLCASLSHALEVPRWRWAV